MRCNPSGRAWTTISLPHLFPLLFLLIGVGCGDAPSIAPGMVPLALRLEFQGEIPPEMVECPEGRFPAEVTHVLVEVSGRGFSRRFAIFSVEQQAGILTDIPAGTNRTVRVFGLDGTDIFDPDTWIYAWGEKFPVTVTSKPASSSGENPNEGVTNVTVDVACVPATMRFSLVYPETFDPASAGISRVDVSLSNPDDTLHTRWSDVRLDQLAVAIDADHAAVLPGRRRIVRLEALDGGRIVARGENRNVELPPGTVTDVPIFFAPVETFLPLGTRMPEARAAHETTPIGEGAVMISGGLTTPLVPATAPLLFRINESLNNLFTPISSLQETAGRECADYVPQQRYGHTVTPLSKAEGGIELLIAGGITADGAATERTEIFDPATGSLCPGPPMQDARAFHAAVRLPDGRVLITGGVNAVQGQFPQNFGGILKTAEIFNDRKFERLLPANECPCGTSSEQRKCLFEPRAGHTATLLADGTVFISGGLTERDGAVVSTNTIERFFPRSDVFELYLEDTESNPNGEQCDPSGSPPAGMITMAQARAFHQATALHDPANPDDFGLVVLTGGVDRTADGEDHITSSIEIFDPEERAIHQPRKGDDPSDGFQDEGEVVKLVCRRAYHQATAIDRENILISGGIGGNNDVGEGDRCKTGAATFDVVLDTVEIYTVTTERIERKKMNEPRWLHRQILLPECMLLTTGGFKRNDGTALDSAEIYPLSHRCP